MKIRELMKQLEKLNPNLVVYIHNRQEYATEVENVRKLPYNASVLLE